jgi:hypothetical protein
MRHKVTPQGANFVHHVDIDAEISVDSIAEMGLSLTLIWTDGRL